MSNKKRERNPNCRYIELVAKTKNKKYIVYALWEGNAIQVNNKKITVEIPLGEGRVPEYKKTIMIRKMTRIVQSLYPTMLIKKKAT